jgi:hypothetical protein
MDIVNKPEVSRSIAGTYVAFVVFIAVLIAFFTYAGFFTPMGILGFVAAAVVSIVEVIIVLILASIYRTRYILSNGELIIRATRLIGGSKSIRLKDVVQVEKTLIPFGLRLFGASFHGGYFKIPGLGRVFMVMTNFDDGVLIRTKQGNYIITPKKPEDFIHAITDVEILPVKNS